MIDAQQIPDEVVNAICKRLAAAAVNHFEARAAIAAALNAWPNGGIDDPVPGGSVPAIILPLPQEPPHDR